MGERAVRAESDKTQERQTHVKKKLRAVPACRFLYPLIAIQDAFEQLGHEGFEVSVGGLADHPVGVAAEGPAGDGADQGLLVAQTLDEVGDELRQVRHHALHTAWKDIKFTRLKRNRATFFGNKPFSLSCQELDKNINTIHKSVHEG